MMDEVTVVWKNGNSLQLEADAIKSVFGGVHLYLIPQIVERANNRVVVYGMYSRSREVAYAITETICLSIPSLEGYLDKETLKKVEDEVRDAWREFVGEFTKKWGVERVGEAEDDELLAIKYPDNYPIAQFIDSEKELLEGFASILRNIAKNLKEELEHEAMADSYDEIMEEIQADSDAP